MRDLGSEWDYSLLAPHYSLLSSTLLAPSSKLTSDRPLRLGVFAIQKIGREIAKARRRKEDAKEGNLKAET